MPLLVEMSLQVLVLVERRQTADSFEGLEHLLEVSKNIPVLFPRLVHEKLGKVRLLA